MEEDIRKEAEKFLNKLKNESNKPKNIYDFNTVVPNYILLQLKNLTEELIEKNKEQEKIIELMLEDLSNDAFYMDDNEQYCEVKHKECDGKENVPCRKCLLEYYEKKAR